jgi:hypothetical protein
VTLSVPGPEVSENLSVEAFINIAVREQLFEDRLPLANIRIIGVLSPAANVFVGPATRLISKLTSVADVLSPLVTGRVTHTAGMAGLTLAVLTEFARRARLTVPLLFSVRALAGLSLCLTGFTALAAMTVAVELKLGRDAAALTFAADKELSALRVVGCHTE